MPKLTREEKEKAKKLEMEQRKQEEEVMKLKKQKKKEENQKKIEQNNQDYERCTKLTEKFSQNAMMLTDNCIFFINNKAYKIDIKKLLSDDKKLKLIFSLCIKHGIIVGMDIDITKRPELNILARYIITEVFRSQGNRDRLAEKIALSCEIEKFATLIKEFDNSNDVEGYEMIECLDDVEELKEIERNKFEENKETLHQHQEEYKKEGISMTSKLMPQSKKSNWGHKLEEKREKSQDTAYKKSYSIEHGYKKEGSVQSKSNIGNGVIESRDGKGKLTERSFSKKSHDGQIKTITEERHPNTKEIQKRLHTATRKHGSQDAKIQNRLNRSGIFDQQDSKSISRY